MPGTFLSTWNEKAQLQGSNCIIISCINFFYRFFQHLPLFPTIATSSSDDLLSDSLVTIDAFGEDCSLSKASGLLPHESLFGDNYMAGWSDLELNTEDMRHVTPPGSYQNNNVPQESLDQIYHLIDTPFDVKWSKISDED